MSFETERTILRAFKPGDSDLLFNLYSDPEIQSLAFTDYVAPKLERWILMEARTMHKHEEVTANVCRQGQQVRKLTTGTYGLTARKTWASVTSLSTCPLHHSCRLAVGWRFAHDHPLSFRVPIRRRLRSWAGSVFYRDADHGGVHL